MQRKGKSRRSVVFLRLDSRALQALHLRGPQVHGRGSGARRTDGTERAAAQVFHTYVYITVKYNNINILSSQVNFDVQVNIEPFNWRRIMKLVPK